MDWRIKGLVQKTLSVLPGGVRLNNWLQQAVGDLRNFEANVDTKVVEDWIVLLSHMRELQVRPQNLDYLEIGAGWYPTLPLCYALVGAGSIRTFDVVRHLNGDLSFRMLRRLERHLPAIAEAGSRPLEQVRADYARFRQTARLEDLLERARIHYLAPADASATGLPDRSLDVVFSNSVLEHVPKDTIARLMRETHRLLRPGGLAIHSVNCGDHYAYFDRRITPINYLVYSERRWRFWNNRLSYQNRLRPRDFLEMAEQAGLCIVLAKHKPRPDLMAALPNLKIAPEFARYSPEQLCSTSIDFVARKE